MWTTIARVYIIDNPFIFDFNRFFIYYESLTIFINDRNYIFPCLFVVETRQFMEKNYSHVENYYSCFKIYIYIYIFTRN